MDSFKKYPKSTYKSINMNEVVACPNLTTFIEKRPKNHNSMNVRLSS